jgi:cytochrome P450
MATYPAWVTKARDMLDEVCGADAERLPSLSDRDRLPYITAAAKEALRWRPFVQTGVPHLLTQDDEYEGYRFPAGTQFTWNAYAIALNEEDYPDPMTFSPERFLDGDLNNPLKGHWQFGTGEHSPSPLISLWKNLIKHIINQDDEYASALPSATTTSGLPSHVSSTALTSRKTQ